MKKLIGVLVFMGTILPAVSFGDHEPLRQKYLEILREEGIATAHGDIELFGQLEFEIPALIEQVKKASPKDRRILSILSITPEKLTTYNQAVQKRQESAVKLQAVVAQRNAQEEERQARLLEEAEQEERDRQEREEEREEGWRQQDVRQAQEREAQEREDERQAEDDRMEVLREQYRNEQYVRPQDELQRRPEREEAEPLPQEEVEDARDLGHAEAFDMFN